MEESFIRVHRDHDSRSPELSDSAAVDTGPATDTATPGVATWSLHESVPAGHDADTQDIRIDRTDAFVIRQARIASPADDVADAVHASTLLDDCVSEFTRRLQACMALTDDEHFRTRVLADIQALKTRCRPEDAFRFELKAARVLAEFGFTAWPLASDTPAPSQAHGMAPVADAPATGGDAAPQPDPQTGARAV